MPRFKDAQNWLGAHARALEISFQESSLLSAFKRDLPAERPSATTRAPLAAPCPRRAGTPRRRATPAPGEEPFALSRAAPVMRPRKVRNPSQETGRQRPGPENSAPLKPRGRPRAKKSRKLCPAKTPRSATRCQGRSSIMLWTGRARRGPLLRPSGFTAEP